MKGPVVASLAFFAVAIGLAGFVVVATEVSGENPISSSEVGDRSRVHQLDTGDCFDVGPTYDASQDVTVLDCDEPHDSEVVWTDNFSTYGSEGEEAVREAVEEAEGVPRSLRGVRRRAAGGLGRGAAALPGRRPRPDP